MDILSKAGYAILLFSFALSIKAEESTPRLHPLESACIEYEMKGPMQKGTRISCFQNFGYEKYETQYTTFGMGFLSKSHTHHTITIGDTIYAINLDSNSGTRTKNLMYQKLVDATSDAEQEEIGMAVFDSMNFLSTDQIKMVAGIPCKVYKSSIEGTVCMSERALMLEQSFGGNTTKAIKVSIGESGDAELYKRYKSAKILPSTN